MNLLSLEKDLEKLNKIPPIVYRILAAKNGRALGPDEIAERSGLSRSTVQRISSKKNWNRVDSENIYRFAIGCGFRFGKNKLINRKLKLLRERGLMAFKHLQVKPSAALWRRGAAANRMKFITRIITQ